MGMFDTYDNLPNNYIPDNSTPKKNIYECLIFNNDMPRKAYDLKNRFIGYSWNYGDTFTLRLSPTKDIKVYDNTLIYKRAGEKPNSNTQAEVIGQKAINVVDKKSWTFLGERTILDPENSPPDESFSFVAYSWAEDQEFCYPIDGDISIPIDMNDNYYPIYVDVYNFRWEKIHTFISENTNYIDCVVDKEVSEKFFNGIYYALVKIGNEDNRTLQKYTFIVGDYNTNHLDNEIYTVKKSPDVVC